MWPPPKPPQDETGLEPPKHYAEVDRVRYDFYFADGRSVTVVLDPTVDQILFLGNDFAKITRAGGALQTVNLRRCITYQEQRVKVKVEVPIVPATDTPQSDAPDQA
jgi:hypothetical protein